MIVGTDPATVPPASPAPRLDIDEALARGVAALEQIAADVRHLRTMADAGSEHAASLAQRAVAAFEQAGPTIDALGRSKLLRGFLGASRG